MAGSRENGNEPSVSIKGGEFREQLSVHWTFVKPGFALLQNVHRHHDDEVA
jgi:hypothetical protein